MSKKPKEKPKNPKTRQQPNLDSIGFWKTTKRDIFRNE
jgi:hypothetical protein